jgi:hypothetical protein
MLRRVVTPGVAISLLAAACSGQAMHASIGEAEASLCLHLAPGGRIFFASVTPDAESVAGFVAALRVDARLLDEAGEHDRANQVGALADSIEEHAPDHSNRARVYLRDGLDDVAVKAIQSELESVPGVTVVSFESKRDAFERFKRLFRDQPELVEGVTPDALPASFLVGLDALSTTELQARMSGTAGVETVIASRLLDLLPERDLELAFTLTGDCPAPSGAPPAP